MNSDLSIKNSEFINILAGYLLFKIDDSNSHSNIAIERVNAKNIG